MSVPTEVPSGSRALRITAIIWLLVLSVNTLINSIGFCHLRETLTNVHNNHVKTAARTARLEKRIEALAQSPLAMTQARFTTVQQTTDARLTRVEHLQNTKASVDDLQALQNRLAQIETRLASTQRARLGKTSRSAPVAKPVAVAPPFRPLAIEGRGGVRFLSIAPPGSASLASVRLLREGDSETGWQLESLESHAAVFLIGGESRRVAVPAETP